MNEKSKARDVKFEMALKKLEEIVTKLEDGDLELEKAIDLFEEGVKMSRLCRNKLGEAEKKIEKLVKDSGGEFTTTEPMDDPSEGAPF
ncbi:hypothetical protein MNBD_NITROSPINAE02-1367 [hydrothermal vent metagenome]|uniref:Uncharacterized protein n=1 Tax=hydrothermal vent metagenome TaxID=652676 RepID=A0A3B1C7K8_9ZZZZ